MIHRAGLLEIMIKELKEIQEFLSYDGITITNIDQKIAAYEAELLTLKS